MVMITVDKLISFIVQQAPRTITGDRVLVVERGTSSLSQTTTRSQTPITHPKCDLSSSCLSYFLIHCLPSLPCRLNARYAPGAF